MAGDDSRLEQDEQQQEMEPVTEKAQLVAWLEAGSTEKEDWRIGTEHEKFLFRLDDFSRPAHDGPDGVAALLQKLAESHGWQPIMEGEAIIGIRDSSGGQITLEPGGQLELSGAPLRSLHETCRETNLHLQVMKEATAPLGLGMLGLGFDPRWTRQEIPWMPKGRYTIMGNYMPKVGNLGLDMMLRSCTIQVNLDFSDEADMVRKFRTSLALQPVATALFANSPFREGGPSGLVSTRAETWTDTDPDRCGVPSCVFEEGFGFERWADYILDVPMYFIHRGDAYLDVAGLSFRDFMAGRLPGYEGQYPRLEDWEDHVTTAFPEVRLKRYLEMRGADGGPWGMICALPALWCGLLYDEQALDEAAVLAKGIDAEAVLAGRLSAAHEGLRGQLAGRPMAELAAAMLKISHGGLQRRGLLDSLGDDETHFLRPLQHIVDSGITQADALLNRYHSAWGQSIAPVYNELQY